MGVLDLSSNKCYPLETPNCKSLDLRERLDCRTGSSVDIFNSRIFVYGGCVLELNLQPGFTLDSIMEAFIEKLKDMNNGYVDTNIDYNSFLSTESFRLSLINRKWSHYEINKANNVEIPAPRMFHAMCTYDNFIYISGGVKFDKFNKLEVLNDVWRFDTLDKQWKCYYPNGNDVLSYRYDHILKAISNLEIFDKSLIHPGISITGGLNKDGGFVNNIELFDILSEKFHIYDRLNLIEFRHSKDESSFEGNVNLRNSLNALYTTTCQISNDTRLYAFDKSPNTDEYEPIILFNNDVRGVRYPRNNTSDINGISDMVFPTMGIFGENIIMVGFTEDQHKISSFIYNYKSGSWTKLKISCMHKIYSHKLSKGFVWESHHKVVFLGASTMNNNAGSITYFDNLIVLSLPFTNFFGKKSMNLLYNSRNLGLMSGSSSMQGSLNLTDIVSTNTQGSKKRADSITSSSSSFSHTRNIPKNVQEHTGGFAGYAYHVAQQMQVNSIKSVLPTYAIAIGKNAFERITSFSDFDFICSDGTTISVPLTLCRRRWGIGFDELFVSAYAQAFLEGNSQDQAYSTRSNSTNSFAYADGNDNGENSSMASKHSNSGPYFRYPFQEKDSQSNMDISPNRTNNRDSLPLVASRHNSLSGSLYPSSALQRVSLSLSQSRRNSYNISSSRNNSVTYLQPSRRSSLSNLGISRRNSTGNPHINQSISRRGSALSRGSVLSSSGNSFNSSSPNPASRPLQNHFQKQQGSNSPTFNGLNQFSLSPISTGSKPLLNDNDQKIPLSHLNSIDLNDVPPPPPMPTVLPDGKPMQNDNSRSLSRTLSEISVNDNTFSKKESISDSTLSNAGNFDGNSDRPLDPTMRFNPLRIPRVLYLPYSRNTVHGIVEYFYSGQLGANWKLFPTGIELLFATKQLSIPLLYDLVLELFFVVLGIMEAALKAKLILYLESKGNFDDKNDHIYSILDIKGNDDLDMDWELLLEAANETRRDSGSTISSDLEFDDNKHTSTINNSDFLDLGPTDKIEPTLISCEMSPTATKFGETSNYSNNLDGINVDTNEQKIKDEGEIKLTTASLDEDGYKSFDDSDDGEENDFLMNSFKKFNLNGKNKEPSEKLKKWPTFKELTNDENKNIYSLSIIELFIETGLLINDTKLMLQAIHVKELFIKVRDIRKNKKSQEEKTDNETKPSEEETSILPKNNAGTTSLTEIGTKSTEHDINDTGDVDPLFKGEDINNDADTAIVQKSSNNSLNDGLTSVTETATTNITNDTSDSISSKPLTRIKSLPSTLPTSQDLVEKEESRNKNALGINEGIKLQFKDNNSVSLKPVKSFASMRSVPGRRNHLMGGLDESASIVSQGTNISIGGINDSSSSLWQSITNTSTKSGGEVNKNIGDKIGKTNGKYNGKNNKDNEKERDKKVRKGFFGRFRS